MRFIPAVSLVQIQLQPPKRIYFGIFFCGPVVKRPKTPPFHGGNTSSNLVRVTKIGKHHKMLADFSFPLCYLIYSSVPSVFLLSSKASVLLSGVSNTSSVLKISLISSHTLYSLIYVRSKISLSLGEVLYLP